MSRVQASIVVRTYNEARLLPRLLADLTRQRGAEYELLVVDSGSDDGTVDLARRAGAHLQTLFIDEGFGSQDSDGRNKLVEAITAIQSDFDMILVITHIDELRDSFPVHLMVDKTPNGSMIRVE